MCCEATVDGVTQCLVSNDTAFAGTELQTAIGAVAPYLLPGYCTCKLLFIVCLIMLNQSYNEHSVFKVFNSILDSYTVI